MKRRTLVIAALLAVPAILAPIRLHKANRKWLPPIRCVFTRDKVVALTYDDGPHPVYTPELLRVLRREHVRATFFMIGARMEKWPGLVKEAAADGNVIADHTYSHPKYLPLEGHERIVHEIQGGEDVIQRLTGSHCSIFRPPKGFLGNHVLQTADLMGYKVVLWSVSAYHHNGARSPQQMAERTVRRAHPGAIILMHDGRLRMRWRDAQATPLIIHALKKQGYRFVTVPELLKMGKPRRCSPMLVAPICGEAPCPEHQRTGQHP